MYRVLIIAFLSTLFLSSCFKEDEMVEPHIPGSVLTAVIPMTQYYSKQVYFSLQNEEIVSSNNRSVFDLNFSCNDTLNLIRLNTSNFAVAAKTPFTKLEDVTDTTGLNWKFDPSNGNYDSLAISNWMEIFDGDTLFENNVWVINRGVNEIGISLGLKKIQFTGLKANSYFFTYSNLDNSERVEAVVEKNDDYSFIQYSMGDEMQLFLEPKITDWDLLFTQYTTMLITDEGEPYPYLLTGVLQNKGVTSVAFDTTLQFESIKLADTLRFAFSDALDKVGYNWKELIGDVNTGDVYYQIKLNYNYIIKSANSYYYKVRFINFYDPLTGEKGYPTFEYQRL